MRYLYRYQNLYIYIKQNYMNILIKKTYIIYNQIQIRFVTHEFGVTNFHPFFSNQTYFNLGMSLDFIRWLPWQHGFPVGTPGPYGYVNLLQGRRSGSLQRCCAWRDDVESTAVGFGFGVTKGGLKLFSVSVCACCDCIWLWFIGCFALTLIFKWHYSCFSCLHWHA